jgi:hypothetical protein
VNAKQYYGEQELQQCVRTKPNRKKLQTSRYERTESVLLEWFKWKWTLYIPIQGQIFKDKAEEIV